MSSKSSMVRIYATPSSSLPLCLSVSLSLSLCRSPPGRAPHCCVVSACCARRSADCAAQGKTGQAAREQRLSFESALVREKDEEGRTALHYAASFGFLEVAKVLCSAGANPSEQDPAGYTPLHFACRWDQPEVAECASAFVYTRTHARASVFRVSVPTLLRWLAVHPQTC